MIKTFLIYKHTSFTIYVALTKDAIYKVMEMKIAAVVLLFFLWRHPPRLHQPSMPAFPILAAMVVRATRFPTALSASVPRAGRVQPVPTVSHCTTFSHLHIAASFSSLLSALENSSSVSCWMLLLSYLLIKHTLVQHQLSLIWRVMLNEARPS